MVNIQIHEKALFKFTGLIPRNIKIPQKFESNVEQMKVVVNDLEIHEQNRIDVEASIDLKGLVLRTNIFGYKTPFFKKRKASGNVLLRFHVLYDYKTKILTAIPTIQKLYLKKFPKFLLFIVKIIFNAFYRSKYLVPLKIDDISLYHMRINKTIVIRKINTKMNTLNFIGSLNKVFTDSKHALELDKDMWSNYKDKDIIAVLSPSSLNNIFFDILPKHYSTGIDTLPDVEFTGTQLKLLSNNNVMLILEGIVNHKGESQFTTKLRAKFSHILEKQHIQLSDIEVESIDIDNDRYGSIKNIIELFIKAYLALPIPLPNPDPLVLPLPEFDTEILLRFCNTSYKITKDKFITAFDIFI